MQFDFVGFVLYLLTALGVYASVIYFYECARSPLAILWSVIFPNRKPLSERYGPWAVITGSSDGIGKQYAINLASKGMNVFLISRTESKLSELAEQIRSQYSVDVQWMAIDFSQGVEIFETIRKSLSGLTIGILVNNVGVAQDGFFEFERSPIQDVQQTISVNITAATMMTHMLLPEMKQRRRGLIINISSCAGLAPMPYLALYGASKAFLTSFTAALSQELRDSGVESQLVTPMFVRTNINEYLHSVPPLPPITSNRPESIGLVAAAAGTAAAGAPATVDDDADESLQKWKQQPQQHGSGLTRYCFTSADCHRQMGKRGTGPPVDDRLIPGA
ncbi:17-beta-hydroxysteroid dehydrogenase type 3-like [Sabethes cyaneus]|uniref:17-beta-hydroxysteroid dehydrogenase type 3-like n=1 Tax=Sabethes cyaneus TaxID=53552 RepID=UPI00237DDE7B|nr:17-beta-hydroxysteroid dehydrogenase type 3-like [Sabethes cyaneus]